MIGWTFLGQICHSDTNVILHDPSCIHQFQDNDIVIPLVVIEEIDRFSAAAR